MTTQPVQIPDIDLLDDSFHLDGPPHELFEQLRTSTPVQQVLAGEQRYWCLTRDAEISAVSKEPATYSSYRAGIYLKPDQVAPLELLRNGLIFMDPPDHSKYRRILSSVFTPNAVKRMEGVVRARVGRTIDQIIEAGRCDFVTDVAVPIPLGVLAELMGIPDEDIPRLLAWTDGIERAQQSPEPCGGVHVYGEMVEYLHGRIQRLRELGDDNLVQQMYDAQVDGESLTEDQVLAFFALLVFAGNDTTRNTAATGMLALLRHPDQWALLCARPERIPNAVEEILRWTSVVKYFARTATTDVELAGQRIAEGDKVVMWFGSASRDDSLNADPERFDVTRDDPRHRAFGAGGPHFCLGHALARLELRVIFEELARRMPDLRLDGEPTYLRSSWVHGLTSMPVRFTPAGQSST